MVRNQVLALNLIVQYYIIHRSRTHFGGKLVLLNVNLNDARLW